MGVGIDVTRYLEVDYSAMAADVRKATDEKPDALIVSVPTEEVASAVATAVAAGIPVFGLNSGYKLADDLGMLAYVAQDDYLAGVKAAEHALNLKNATNINSILFVNHEHGNSGLNDRFEGFSKIMNQRTGKAVEEFIIDGNASEDIIMETFNSKLQSCSFDVVMLAGLELNEIREFEKVIQDCPNDILLATFDVSSNVYEDIVEGDIAFGISQQEFLQGALPVQLASVYVTTGKLPAPPLGDNEGVYLSGPAIIDINNVPSDTQQVCAEDGFPTCRSEELGVFGNEKSECPCIDRSKIRLAGIMHGVTTDSFWDLPFAASQQSAIDMGVDLELDRFDPPAVGETNDDIHKKMANKIRSLCDDDIDGLFVSIPSDEVLSAIKYCQELKVPVVSVNSGADFSRQLGLLHHVGQLEYEAGHAAGKKMASESGITQAWCVNHEPENTALDERCNGFQAAIHDANGVEYMGVIEVPHDNEALWKRNVESALAPTISAGSYWGDQGFLLLGRNQLSPALQLKEAHPDLTMGTFDVSNEIYDALDRDLISFGIDQQPYLQGYLPVMLLSTYAYSQQRLQNEFIESGPSFVTSSPSAAELDCETNLFKACSVDDVPFELPSFKSEKDVNVAAIVGGVVGGFVLVLTVVAVAIVCKSSKNEDLPIVVTCPVKKDLSMVTEEGVQSEDQEASETDSRVATPADAAPKPTVSDLDSNRSMV